MRGARLAANQRLMLLGAAVGLVGVGVAAKQSIGSDHQQTALTELNPQIDITDTWVFPGSSDDRIVLAMTVASPILGNQNARFDPNALYQIKVDNNQDGREDLVLQFSFDQMTNGTQTFDVIGPVAPNPATGTFAGPGSGAFGQPGVRDRFAGGGTPAIRRAALNSTSVSGTLPAVGSTASGSIQAFAGVVDDPFYVDLEQFFRIIPDRRPTEGPLSLIGGTIASYVPGSTGVANFRPKCGSPNTTGFNSTGFPTNPAPFNANLGCAVDFLAGINALAIVVELPEAQLTRGQGGADPLLGVWATVSR